MASKRALPNIWGYFHNEPPGNVTIQKREQKGWYTSYYTEGQLISKGLFGILEFFQKTNKRIRF